MVSETRYMRNALSEYLDYPSGYNIIHGSLSSGTLLKLHASDDDYMVFNSALVGTDQICEVEFTGSHVGHMPFLQCLIELHASVSVFLEIAAYNYNTDAYETAPPMFDSVTLGTSDVTRYLYHILNNRNYRSATGEWKIKIKCTKDGGSPAAFTVSIDYLYYRTVAYELGTSRTTSCQSMEQNVRGATVGIRIWKVNSDDTETEIDPDGSHATVNGPSSTTVLSNTWSCPATSDVVAVIVRVYKGADILTTVAPESGGLVAVFITEDLDTNLLAVTWTVYYSFEYLGAPFYITFYRFGASTCDSRITNFSYGVPPKIRAGLNVAQVLPLILND